MALKDITKEGVESAIKEFNRFGPRNMQKQFGGDLSTCWYVRVQYNHYDQKLLLRVAHWLQGLGHLPSGRGTFTALQARKHLESLNFIVVKRVEVPSVLYRAVNSESAFENHVMGMLYFRSFKYFREVEGIGHDELEGVGSYIKNGIAHRDVSDIHPLQPAYLMCFSEDINSIRKFGDSCIKLCDPVEFEWRVQKSLPPEITSVKWCKVDYTKTKTIEGDISIVEQWHRAYCCKPKEFSAEKEWRLIIRFRHTFRPFNNTLKIHVNDRLEDLFKLQPLPNGKI